MLPLGMVNLFGMHIIPPLAITAGYHFTHPQREGGLSQPQARLSHESLLLYQLSYPELSYAK